MTETFKDFLFDRGYLVADTPEELTSSEKLCLLVTLGRKCGIRVKKGWQLLTKAAVKYAVDRTFGYVPEPFYRGFPDSVRQLTPDQRLFDQVYHYFQTYGKGEFDGIADHSILESFEKVAFEEDWEPKEYTAVDSVEAYGIIFKALDNLADSPRPLPVNSIDLMAEAFSDEFLHWFPTSIGCKITAADLLVRTKDMRLVRFLQLPDLIKLLERIQYLNYGSEKLNQLNLKNQDRKLLTKVLDTMLERSGKDKPQYWGVTERECFEKRETWKGLLHHLHYKPKNELARNFVSAIRTSPDNRSAYAMFEAYMRRGYVADAAAILNQAKGSGAVLRNLNYILSRCRTYEEVKEVFKCLE